MAFNSVIINQLSGGVPRQPQGLDHYSALQLYGTAPAVTGKWAETIGTPTVKTQQIFSVQDAEDAGIVPYADNTAATASYVISAFGATGDTVEPIITFPTQNGGTDTLSLGEYEILSSQTTIDLQGAALAAKINAGTVTHGATATYTAGTDTLAITAPKYFGISLNAGTPLSFTITGGTFAGTITQFASGTFSNYAIWHYHISEFFRIMPDGNLRVSIISATSSFNEIGTTQKAADSKIRQIGIYDTSTTRASAANITGTITQINDAAQLCQGTAPLSVFYSPNVSAITDWTTYPDQNLNTSNKVSCVISQDGMAAGALLFVRSGQSIGNIGAKLATVAKSRVSASDAQPIDSFNISDGVENNIPAFANGDLSSDISLGTQTQLNDYNYTFIRQFGDTVVGSYWNDNRCCVVNTSDYANVNDNRVSDKVSRICYSTLVPQLNSELIFNTDGTLQDYTVLFFENLVKDAITASMITGFGSLPLISGVGVTINPTQPVKQTGNLVIDVTIIQNGIARKITVNLGYALSL